MGISAVMENVIMRAGELVWGPWTVALVILAGCWLSASNRWFQFGSLRLWWSGTIGTLIKGKSTGARTESKGKISPFQSTTAALAGTLGTGNIVGVAAAIAVGGAGAVFWMWIAAIPGMMTSFSENVLGILYRKRDEKGEWLGGPMLYMRDGLRTKGLAAVWAALCAFSAFGVGNVVQVNAIASTAKNAWGIPAAVTGILVAGLAAPSVIGGARSVTRLTERLVPFMAGAYMLACIAVIAINFREIPSALASIVNEAFSPAAAGGGFLGVMLVGVRRGVFTNEAGMGSSVMVHCTAETDHPVEQGMWGMFEVFLDTIVMCTITALALLTSGAARGPVSDYSAMTARAFSQIFGRGSDSFVALAVLLFAFATVVGWSCCGERAFGYLFGAQSTWIYKLLYVALIIPGCLVKMDIVWAASDILNGLMAIPNTVAVVLLWRQVREQTEDYTGARRLKPKRALAPGVTI